MVKKEQIEKILNNIISNIDTKCGPTIAEIYSSLDNYTKEEKEKALSEILYEGQMHQYKAYRNSLYWCYDELGLSEDGTDILIENNTFERGYHSDEYWEEYLNDWNEDERDKDFIISMKDLEKKVFDYEKLIITGYPHKEENVNVNIDDYREDTQLSFEDRGKISEVEQKLIDQQMNVELTDKNIDGCNHWFTSANINHEIYNSHDYQKLKYESPPVYERIHNENSKAKRQIDETFDKLSPIGEKIVAYRGGTIDELVQVGDTIKLKGYTSATTQKSSADTYLTVKSRDSGEFDFSPQWSQKILINENNKVLCANDPRFNNGISEHEIVLPRNLDARVVSMDYENKEVVLEV